MAPVDGHKVCIFSGKKTHMKKLEKICNRPDTKDLPVFVLAVAGEFRTGKSFLLSYFLRYLANHSKVGKNWMGSAGEPLIGFDHKSECDPVTQGINVWSKPFKIMGPGKKEMLVLIMDCQGVFCSKDEEEATRVFALATMVTSCMIFNLSKQINQSIMGHLELFTAYANMATAAEKGTKPFQKAMLLIRDWQNANKHSCGPEGGAEYLKSSLKEKNSLHDTYREIKCYLMPKPGDIVDDENYDGNFGALREDFTKQLTQLTESLLGPKHIASNLKEVTGKEIKAQDFCKYFKECSELIVRMDWEDPSDMIKMNAKFSSGLAKEKALKVYNTDMEENTNSFKSKPVMNEQKLNGLNDKAMNRAIHIYVVESKFTKKNEPDVFEEDKNALNEDLKAAFVANFKNPWRAKKAEEVAQQQAQAERAAAARAREAERVAQQQAQAERAAAARSREAERVAQQQAQAERAAAARSREAERVAQQQAQAEKAAAARSREAERIAQQQAQAEKAAAARSREAEMVAQQQAQAEKAAAARSREAERVAQQQAQAEKAAAARSREAERDAQQKAEEADERAREAESDAQQKAEEADERARRAKRDAQHLVEEAEERARKAKKGSGVASALLGLVGAIGGGLVGIVGGPAGIVGGATTGATVGANLGKAIDSEP